MLSYVVIAAALVYNTIYARRLRVARRDRRSRWGEGGPLARPANWVAGGDGFSVEDVDLASFATHTVEIIDD